MFKALRLLMVGAFAAVLALSPAAQAQSQPQAAEAIRPALWVARDGDSRVYLYGTVHLRRPGGAWADPRVEAALADSQTVWTEIEISDGAEQAMIPLVQRLGLSPQRPLSSVLTPAQRNEIEASLQPLGLPFMSIEAMRPWLAAVTLAVMPMTAAGYDPRSGVDRSVDQEARRQGKAMRAFETAEQQLNFFASLDERLQVEMLLDTARTSGQGATFLADLERAWERGEVAALERIVVTEMRADYPDLYDVFFTRRNRAWTDALMTEMAGSGTVFVAVGAGHLVGPDSVVAMLQARGISVEPVDRPNPRPRRTVPRPQPRPAPQR